MPARVAPTRAHPSVAGVHHAQSTNISTHRNASFVAGDVPFAYENAPFAAGDVPFANGNASFTDRGCALCGWKRLLYGWGCAFYGWKRLLYGWGCAFCGWKRRCADVRAGTQAPPLPFQHMSPFRKDENKSFNACGASANGKTKVLTLAELPQIVKQKNWRLRSFRKRQNKKFDACGASASVPKERMRQKWSYMLAFNN